jgi:hypothetical protein
MISSPSQQTVLMHFVCSMLSNKCIFSALAQILPNSNTYPFMAMALGLLWVSNDNDVTK